MEYYLDGSDAICKYKSYTGETKVLTVRDCDFIIPCTQDEMKDIILKQGDAILFDYKITTKLGTVIPENKIRIKAYDFRQGQTHRVISITENIVTEDCYYIKDNAKKYLYVNVEKTIPA